MKRPGIINGREERMPKRWILRRERTHFKFLVLEVARGKENKKMRGGETGLARPLLGTT